MAADCATKLIVQKKSLVATWDDSSVSESDSDESQHEKSGRYCVLMATTSPRLSKAVKQICILDDEYLRMSLN